MHLTDAARRPAPARHHDDGDEDPRGDDSRAGARTPRPPADAAHARAGAADPGRGRRADRRDPPRRCAPTPAANIRGGAALLAALPAGRSASRSAPAATRPPGTPRWPATPARHADAAAAFADEVFDVIRARRVPDHRRRPAGHARRPPGTARQRPGWTGSGLRKPPARTAWSARRRSRCEWIPAPYEQSLGDRRLRQPRPRRPARAPEDRLHRHPRHRGAPTTTTLKLVQDPTYVSWHYTLRSADGHVAQHVRTKDVAWHAGNWYVNAKSIGLEHEGFARAGRHLVHRGDVPRVGEAGALPRREVRHPAGPRSTSSATTTSPAPRPSTVRGHALGPGPVLGLGALLRPAAARRCTPRPAPPATGLVMIRPDYANNQPAVHRLRRRHPAPRARRTARRRSCCAPRRRETRRWSRTSARTRPAAPRTMSVVRPRRPRPDRPDLRRGRAGRATGRRSGTSARRPGSTTRRPHPTADLARGLVVTPKPGRADASRCTAAPTRRRPPTRRACPSRRSSPLQYTFAAGQRYAVGGCVPGEYYRASDVRRLRARRLDGDPRREQVLQIQFGHRVMYVNLADDVKVSFS